MVREIFHDHHRQLRVVMQNIDRVLRGVFIVLDQRLRFQACAIKG